MSLFLWDLERSTTSNSLRVMERPSLPLLSVSPWVHRNYCPKAHIAVIPERLGVTQWLIKKNCTSPPLLSSLLLYTLFSSPLLFYPFFISPLLSYIKIPALVNLISQVIFSPLCEPVPLLSNWVIKPPDEHGDLGRLKCSAATFCISIVSPYRKGLADILESLLHIRSPHCVVFLYAGNKPSSLAAFSLALITINTITLHRSVQYK